MKYSDIVLSTVADTAYVKVFYYINGYDNMITNSSGLRGESCTLKAGTYSYYYNGSIDMDIRIDYTGHYYNIDLNNNTTYHTSNGPTISLDSSHTINNKGSFTINKNFTVSNTYSYIDHESAPNPHISKSISPDSKIVDGNVTIGGIVYRRVQYSAELANY